MTYKKTQAGCLYRLCYALLQDPAQSAAVAG